MDSVTQAALGAAVGGAVAHRQLGWRAYAAGALLGTLPDLDVLIRYDNAVDNVTRHRGFSHSLFVLTLFAPALALLLQRGLKHWREHLSWRRAALLCWLVLITHPLLDAFTSYGTQLFWPLTSPPVSISSIFIIDPFYTLPLLVGALLAIIRSRRYGSERGVRSNLWGLGISSGYLLISLLFMLQVKSLGHQALAKQSIDGSIFVSPTPFNILLWRVVAVDQQQWYSGYVSVWDHPRSVTLEPQGERSLQLAPDLYAVQRLDWFTRGFYALEQRDDGLVITDLRLGVEPFLPFQFLIAEHAPDEWLPTPPIQLPQIRPDKQELGWIWHRIQSPQAGPPANYPAKE